MICISASSSLPGIEHACVVILDLQNMHAHPMSFFQVDRLYTEMEGTLSDQGEKFE